MGEYIDEIKEKLTNSYDEFVELHTSDSAYIEGIKKKIESIINRLNKGDQLSKIFDDDIKVGGKKEPTLLDRIDKLYDQECNSLKNKEGWSRESVKDTVSRFNFSRVGSTIWNFLARNNVKYLEGENDNDYWKEVKLDDKKINKKNYKPCLMNMLKVVNTKETIIEKLEVMSEKAYVQANMKWGFIGVMSRWNKNVRYACEKLKDKLINMNPDCLKDENDYKLFLGIEGKCNIWMMPAEITKEFEKKTVVDGQYEKLFKSFITEESRKKKVFSYFRKNGAALDLRKVSIGDDEDKGYVVKHAKETWYMNHLEGNDFKNYQKFADA